LFYFFFSSRRRHTRFSRDWSSDVCSSDLYSERPELEGEIYIAYCPERVLPGNVMYELVHNDRVIGGVDQSSTDKAVAFYKQFIRSEERRVGKECRSRWAR